MNLEPHITKFLEIIREHVATNHFENPFVTLRCEYENDKPSLILQIVDTHDLGLIYRWGLDDTDDFENPDALLALITSHIKDLQKQAVERYS